MECFTHSGQQSVTLCKICHKALCHNCSQFSAKSYVCSDVCAEEEKKLDQVTSWSVRYVGDRKGSGSSRQYYFLAATFVIFGLSIIAPLLYDYIMHQIPIYPSSLIIGIAMLVGAFLLYRSQPK
jgi:hypothetical protein